MKTHSNPQSAEWIFAGRFAQCVPSDSPAWACRVENLIPPHFEQYAKILHWLEVHDDNIENSLTPRENALLGISPCDEIRSFVERRRADGVCTRVRWSEIAEYLGIPFEPEINHEWFARKLRPDAQCWPRFIYGPADGTLSAEERTELARILAPYCVDRNCSFRFAEMPFIATELPILFEGNLDELNTFMTERRYQYSPEYWWPDNHSWCVCSDYDLAFSIVAGPAELIDSVLKSEVLEAVRVTPATRVDSRVPSPR